MKAEEFDKRQENESKREYRKFLLFGGAIVLLLGIFLGVWLSSDDRIVKETTLIDGIGDGGKLIVLDKWEYYRFLDGHTPSEIRNYVEKLPNNTCFRIDLKTEDKWQSVNCKNETVGTFIVGESCSPEDFEEVSCVLYNDSVVSMGVYNLARWSELSDYRIFRWDVSIIVVDYKILAVLGDCDSTPKIDFFYSDKYSVIKKVVNLSDTPSYHFEVGGCDIRVEFFTIRSSCIGENTTVKSFNVCKPVYENITKEVCVEGKNCNEESWVIMCEGDVCRDLGTYYFCPKEKLKLPSIEKLCIKERFTKTVCEEYR